MLLRQHLPAAVQLRSPAILISWALNELAWICPTHLIPNDSEELPVLVGGRLGCHGLLTDRMRMLRLQPIRRVLRTLEAPLR